MKPIYVHLGSAIALSFSLAACVPAPDSTPTPTPTPIATASSQPSMPAPAPVVPDNWMDAPKSSGDWHYSSDSLGSTALFGDSKNDPRFYLRCDRARHRITFMRAADAPGPLQMRIRTETADRILNAEPTEDDLPFVSSSVSAADPILDAMALSKGRFAVETPGAITLYLPAWAEVTRVIEDCR